MASYGQNHYGVQQYGQQTVVGTPAFRAQSPAPGATSVSATTSLYFEIFLSPSGFNGDTVMVYLDDTLVWRGSRIMPGFEGERTALTDGFAYTVVLPDPFERGLHTIRGTAALGMDETYQFATAEFTVTPEDIEATLNQTAGLDLLLGGTDHDISVVSADLSLVAGADEVAQHLGVGLRLFRGEWYLDDTAGVPYYQSFFVAGPNTRTIETTLRQEIQGDPDVDSLSEFGLELDRLTRKLYVSFIAESTYGDVEVSAVFP
jgi:hypothetical protein